MDPFSLPITASRSSHSISSNGSRPATVKNRENSRPGTAFRSAVVSAGVEPTVCCPAAAAASFSHTEWLVAEEEKQSDSPNEKIGMACIGVGGRGSDHISNMIKRSDVEVLYVCDADENIGRNRQREIEKQTGKQPQYVKDMRRIFDDQSVQAITTATPTIR